MNIFVVIVGCLITANAQYQSNSHQYARRYDSPPAVVGNQLRYAAPPAAQQTHYAFSVPHRQLSYGSPVVSQDVRYANQQVQQANAQQVNVVAATVAAAPPVSTVGSGVQPRTHTIHTHSARQQIRVEEFSAPHQVIRVHEGPQAPPQVVQIRAPASPQSVVRVISRTSGPAHVERVVHEAAGVQIIDVHRPPPPPARIVQIVRAPPTPPRVVFHQEAGGHDELRVEQPHAPSAFLAPVQGVSAAPVHTFRQITVPAAVQNVAVPSSSGVVQPGPGSSPAGYTVVPSVSSIRSFHAPTTSISHAPIPVGVGYTMYGVGYGRVYSRHFTSKASRASS